MVRMVARRVRFTMPFLVELMLAGPPSLTAPDGWAPPA